MKPSLGLYSHEHNIRKSLEIVQAWSCSDHSSNGQSFRFHSSAMEEPLMESIVWGIPVQTKTRLAEKNQYFDFYLNRERGTRISYSLVT